MDHISISILFIIKWKLIYGPLFFKFTLYKVYMDSNKNCRYIFMNPDKIHNPHDLYKVNYPF